MTAPASRSPLTPTVIWPVLNLHKGDNLFTGISINSAVIKDAGYRSVVVQADLSSLRRALRNTPHAVLAFSTPTVYVQTYLELCRLLKKEFSFFSAFGGPHPTYFPEMIEEEGVDGVCRGEGEFALLELLGARSRGESVAQIPNWWIRENGGIHRNPLRPLIRDLDELPLPDHEIFREAIPHAMWQAMVITSRGCPYSCTYCYNHVYKKLYEGLGRVVRRRSVDHVMQELRAVRAHRCYRFVRFLDDLFILDPAWVEEFAVAYRRDIGLPFSCMVRANHVTPGIVKNLRDAGCWRVQMGLESGDDYVRNTIFKRSMAEEEIVGAARLLSEAGIKVVTGNIVGAPGSTFEADLKTLRLNMRIRPAYAGVALLQPYPGTDIYQCAQDMGMLDPASLDLTQSTVSRVSTLRYGSRKEKSRIENLQKLFFIPVEFPPLLPVAMLLMQLPANRVFHFVFSRWVNYAQYFRCIPPKVGWRSVLKRSLLYTRLAALLARARIPARATAVAPPPGREDRPPSGAGLNSRCPPDPCERCDILPVTPEIRLWTPAKAGRRAVRGRSDEIAIRPSARGSGWPSSPRRRGAAG